MDKHSVKFHFDRLLRKVGLVLKNPKSIKDWNNIIKIYKNMSADDLQKKFFFNNFYQIEFLIEKDFQYFQLAKMPVLYKYKNNRELYNKILEIDEILDEQMSSILCKMFIADKIIAQVNTKIIEEIHEVIVSLKENNCILKELFNYYHTVEYQN